MVHDGAEGWLIDDGKQTEVSFAAHSSILLSKADGLRSLQGTRSAANGWVKPLFRGELLNLTNASGDIRGSDTVCGRPCLVAEVRGLRSDEPTVSFRLTVDTVDGIIMKLDRPDTADLIEVTELTIATPLPKRRINPSRVDG